MGWNASWMRRRPPARALALALAAAAGSLAAAGPAGAAPIEVGVKAGTLGLGAEVTVGLGLPLLDLRGGANVFSLTRRETAGGNQYDAKARLRNGTVVLDLHPFAGSFRVSGGLVFNANSVEGDTVTPASGAFRIGDIQVPVAFLSGLHGKADYNTVAPYLGLGWARRPSAGPGLGGFLELGAFYQGHPKVTLTPRIPPGSPLNIPLARAALDVALATEEQRVADKIDKLPVYPVVSLGLSFGF